jgi:hypothetical protein
MEVIFAIGISGYFCASLDQFSYLFSNQFLVSLYIPHKNPPAAGNAIKKI